MKMIYLQSIPLKNAVDVASNGERFTLTNAANLKTYIPSKIKKKKVIKKLTVVVFIMEVDWGLIVKLALPAKVTRRANKVIGIYDRSH
jgi:hypothetical protein